MSQTKEDSRPLFKLETDWGTRYVSAHGIDHVQLAGAQYFITLSCGKRITSNNRPDEFLHWLDSWST